MVYPKVAVWLGFRISDQENTLSADRHQQTRAPGGAGFIAGKMVSQSLHKDKRMLPGLLRYLLPVCNVSPVLPCNPQARMILL